MIKNKIQEKINKLIMLQNDDRLIAIILKAADSIVHAVKTGKKLMICGNGGSAADAQHIAGEFLCRFYKDRNPMPAIALSTDTSVITAISNDYSYDDIFSRQVTALGKEGDVILGISTSGNSRNVLEAFKSAQKNKIQTILLTGNIEREIWEYSNIVINVPSPDTPTIQEMHLIIEHLICEIVEKKVNE